MCCGAPTPKVGMDNRKISLERFAFTVLLTVLLSPADAAVKVDARERAKRTILKRTQNIDMRREELPPLNISELLQLSPGVWYCLQ